MKKLVLGLFLTTMITSSFSQDLIKTESTSNNISTSTSLQL